MHSLFPSLGFEEGGAKIQLIRQWNQLKIHHQSVQKSFICVLNKTDRQVGEAKLYLSVTNFFFLENETELVKHTEHGQTHSNNSQTFADLNQEPSRN